MYRPINSQPLTLSHPQTLILCCVLAACADSSRAADFTPRTRIEIVDGRWHLNGAVTYPGAAAEGLLMNVRMVNATFEDPNRKDFDPDANTAAFLKHMPEYVAHGVRAFTLCLQGGMPGYEGAVNSAFNEDGSLRDTYLARVARVIEACDRHGVAVILGCFYQRQDQVLSDEAAVRAGVVNVVHWIERQGYTNVVLEIANEFPHGGFDHKLLRSAAGEAELVRLAKATQPKLLVSTSGIGDGRLPDAVAEASDFLLIHFNGVKLEDIPARIQALQRYGKPIVCNEDDKTGAAAARAAELSVENRASWGLMLSELNQYFPLEYHGAVDDPVVYAKLKTLTSAISSTRRAANEDGGSKIEDGKARDPRSSILDPPRQPPRLIILTDIGGDPDDRQSMIRLMLYANEFEIEGLIATAAGVPGELNEAATKPELVREIVEAYGQVRGNLARHAEGYPPAEELLAKVKSGNRQRRERALGAAHDTDGSRWIIEVVDRDDPRPVNVAIWGGQTDFAQALWRVREDRGADSLAQFLSRLRVHDIDDQDRLQGWLFQNFPDLFYVLSKAPPGGDKRLGAYRGMYLGGDESLTSKEWLDEHVRRDHGPLGALYPDATWTAPNPHVGLKEGDTPSWLYFVPNGLSDPSRPEWGGWGGRFERADRGLFRDAPDSVDGTTEPRAGVWRWRTAVQNEFRARMDWCVQPPQAANHRPHAVLEGDRSGRVLELEARTGEVVRLTAAGSRDPDGDDLAFRWWVYSEAGSYRGDVPIDGGMSLEPRLSIPDDAAGRTVHVVLELTDAGTPPLTAYRRVALNVQ